MEPPDDDEDLGLTPAQRQKLRRGLVQALAKAGAAGNASAAKTALELIDGPKRTAGGRDAERDAVLDWLAEHPDAGAVEAVAHFWPGLPDAEREKAEARVRQWRHRHGSNREPAARPERPAPDLEWASLPKVAFLRRQLAELLADLQFARMCGETARVPALDSRVSEIREQLDVALAEAGETEVELDRSPGAVAEAIDQREKLLEVFRRARARAQAEAASRGGGRDL
jgi:hypothetical protein